MTIPKTGEASPNNNTAEIKNPLPFDELSLAKLFQQQSLPETPAPEAKPEKKVEPVEEPAEEAEAETPEQTGEEPATPPEEEQTPEEETTEQPETEVESQGVQKRINKLVAQKKEAQERADSLAKEVETLQAKLHEVEAAPPAPAAGPGPNAFSEVWDDGKLKEKWEQARTLKRWCEDHVDGTELNGQEYSSEDIRQIRRNVEDALEVQIPQRAQYLQRYRQIRPEAERIYPFWKDRASADYVDAQAVLRQMPTLASFPEYQILVGDFLRGRAARLLAQSAPKPKAALPPKAPKQPSAPASAPRKDEATAMNERQRNKFMESGGVEALAQLLKGL